MCIPGSPRRSTLLAVAAFEAARQPAETEAQEGRGARAFDVVGLSESLARFRFPGGHRRHSGQGRRGGRQADKQLITETEVFDVFAGGNVEVGKKSLAVGDPAGHGPHPDRREIDVADKVVANVAKATGATLRG